jgi:hypothetical protein
MTLKHWAWLRFDRFIQVIVVRTSEGVHWQIHKQRALRMLIMTHVHESEHRLACRQKGW